MMPVAARLFLAPDSQFGPQPRAVSEDSPAAATGSWTIFRALLLTDGQSLSWTQRPSIRGITPGIPTPIPPISRGQPAVDPNGGNQKGVESLEVLR